ncbi:YceI family protein [Aegicerativicinus sediminis]|uniref:YceI family protein n=1 Tax=Aegicerativicinus sediminis TaxID=2893202 RepID=UPI001E630E51|nr:YceI family protein [Aegicerativicinus sediminis]
MKPILNIQLKGIFLLAILILSSNYLLAQQYSKVGQGSNVTIEGTSNLHDWEMTSNSYSVTLLFDQANSNLVTKLSAVIPAESLKSGKKGMDKNAYKALNTDKHKNISFEMTSVDQAIDKGTGVYELKTKGNLTINGVKKNIPLTITLKNNGTSISLSGSTVFNMTEYKVEPPTALFGTVTTGDKLTIKFKTILNN